MKHSVKYTPLSFFLSFILIFTACEQDSFSYTKVPENQLINQIPNVEMAGYFLIKPETPLVFLQGKDEEKSAQQLKIQSIEIVFKESQIDHAFRLMSHSNHGASLLSKNFKGILHSGSWTFRHESFVMHGNSQSSWADKLQAAWRNEETASFKSRYPKAWNLSNSLPLIPNETILGTGFIPNAQKNSAILFENTTFYTEELISALRLLRINTMAFSVLSDTVQYHDINSVFDIFDRNDLGIVLVADSDYPSTLLNFLVERLSGNYGVSEIQIAGRTGRIIGLPNNNHLIFIISGSSLFFYISDSLERSKKLAGAD